MGNIIDNLAKQFKAQELTLIAEVVKLSPVARWGNRQYAEAIISSISKNGIPDAPVGKLSSGQELLEDFLYVAGYIDKDGNLVDESNLPSELTGDIIGPKRLSLEQFMQKENIATKPDCFSFADDGDVNCSCCRLYPFCAEKRLSSLPQCFGLMWDSAIVDCVKHCIEAPFCKDVVLSKDVESTVENI